MFKIKTNNFNFLFLIFKKIIFLGRKIKNLSESFGGRVFSFLRRISGLVFRFILCVLIVIVVAQLLYILERSLTFRKELSIANQLRIVSRIIANNPSLLSSWSRVLTRSETKRQDEMIGSRGYPEIALTSIIVDKTTIGPYRSLAFTPPPSLRFDGSVQARSLQDNRKKYSFTQKFSDLFATTAKVAYAAEKPEYQASRIQQSYPYIINLKAGKGFTFWVKFKNKGSQTWQSNEVSLKTASNKKGAIYHPWWASENQASLLKKTTSSEEIGLFKFAIRAPEYNGIYWEKFNLYKGSTLIPGGDIEVPVRVYGGKSAQINTEQKTEEHRNKKTEAKWWQEVNADLSQVQQDLSWQEPKIRVALYYIDSKEIKDYLPIQIKSENLQGLAPRSPGVGGYEVRDKDNYLLLKQTAGELTEIDFDFNLKRYFVNINGKRYLSTDSYLKFLIPEQGAQSYPASNPSTDSGIIFQIPSFNNNTFWGSPVSDNRYRGELEIHYNPNTDRLWIINELPMEDYLKGIAEVSDSSPKEFLKAQIIAARTYAMFRKTIPKYINTPDESNLFTLKATQADQVYRGYGAELRNPQTVEAVKETKGIMVFYQGNIAKTYYFAQTDGRTRDCQAVGMCKDFTPYLVARNDPPGQGKNLRGHGVGLPQVGGLEAARQGANFLQILKYYYPGTELKKVY